jgi:hypothetical protein
MNGCLVFCALALTQPAPGDFTPEGLNAAVASVLATHGGDYRQLPLDLKAEFFEWQLWRYHRTSYHQVVNVARLPGEPGQLPRWLPANDTSTWNGALLAALSYKYAVTRHPATLDRIEELLEGLRLFFAITGQPGLMARAMTDRADLAWDDMQRAEGPDGVMYHFRADPAKGTYNQIAGGYAALMMHAAADLPQRARRLARRDAAALVLHLVDHDYRATHRDGSRTTYGDLTPMMGTVGVPFNAQVAYQIVALGHCFPPDDPAEKARIDEQFRRLRDKHHVYYEHPLRNLVQPQRVGASVFVKGMNDRHHVMTAAFTGLTLELHQAQRDGRPLDRKFTHQLGQTCLFTMQKIGADRNALCNFMWSALLADPAVRECIVERRSEAVQAAADQGLLDGVAQLRRFPLDRLRRKGKTYEARQALWIDQRQLDDYHWKTDPRKGFEATGPAGDHLYCAIDYLYAYWLLRYARLDESIVLSPHAVVLGRTPGLSISQPVDGAFVEP